MRWISVNVAQIVILTVSLCALNSQAGAKGYQRGYGSSSYYRMSSHNNNMLYQQRQQQQMRMQQQQRLRAEQQRQDAQRRQQQMMQARARMMQMQEAKRQKMLADRNRIIERQNQLAKQRQIQMQNRMNATAAMKNQTLKIQDFNRQQENSANYQHRMDEGFARQMDKLRLDRKRTAEQELFTDGLDLMVDSFDQTNSKQSYVSYVNSRKTDLSVLLKQLEEFIQ